MDVQFRMRGVTPLTDPDNPFLFLLRSPTRKIDFQTFLSLVPASYLVVQGRPRHMRALMKTYKMLSRLLGDEKVIYRQSVASFSKTKLKQNASLYASPTTGCVYNESCGGYNCVYNPTTGETICASDCTENSLYSPCGG